MVGQRKENIMAATAVSPDFGGVIDGAVDTGTGIVTDNLLALFALPVLWVGYKVVRKIVGKIG